MSTTPDREGWWWGRDAEIMQEEWEPYFVSRGNDCLVVEGDGWVEPLARFEWGAPCPTPKHLAGLEEKAAGFDQLYASLLGAVAAPLDTDVAVGSRLAGAMGVFEALTANVATLVEQLADSERAVEHNLRRGAELTNERDALVEQLGEAERRLVEVGSALTEPDRGDKWRVTSALLVLAKQPAGAAQPVVGPRDGLRKRCEELLAKFDANRAWTCNVKEIRDVLAGLLAGYAPHPSGTEGPLREALSMAQELDVAWKNEGTGYAETYVDGKARLVQHLRAALAASPPDGTAPERPHRLTWSGTEWVAPCGCRYHPDDDNGTHSGAPHVHRCEKHVRAAPEYIPSEAELRSHERALADSATRPPDGMPGEPARERVSERRAPDCIACNRYDDPPGPHHAEMCERYRRAAAPPTVPGEPPRRRKRCEGVVEPVGINRTDAAPPTPPLTPVDNAAVRAALVAVRDDAYVLGEDCDEHNGKVGELPECPTCALALQIDAALASTAEGAEPA